VSRAVGVLNKKLGRGEGRAPGNAGAPSRSAGDNRLFFEAVLWLGCAMARSARDLRQVVLGVETRPPLGAQGGIRAGLQSSLPSRSSQDSISPLCLPIWLSTTTPCAPC